MNPIFGHIFDPIKLTTHFRKSSNSLQKSICEFLIVFSGVTYSWNLSLIVFWSTFNKSKTPETNFQIDPTPLNACIVCAKLPRKLLIHSNREIRYPRSHPTDGSSSPKARFPTQVWCFSWNKNPWQGGSIGGCGRNRVPNSHCNRLKCNRWSNKSIT